MVAGIAVLSMLIGSFLGVVQDDVRRLLAYSGVAHAGFILTGVVAGRSGTGGVWFYLAVYAVQLVGAYAVVAAVSGPASAGSALSRYSGLGKRQPFLALGLTVLLLGMAGIPLTSGFIAKFGVFQEAWRAGFGWLVVVALLASVVSFFIYLRVIVAMYMGDGERRTGALLLASPFRRRPHGRDGGDFDLRPSSGAAAPPGRQCTPALDAGSSIAVAGLLVLIPIAAAARLTQSDLVLVRADDVVTEDLYAAGNRITIEGRIEGDLIAAAFEEVLISGEVTGDVTVVAGRVTITGTVGGSVRVAAGLVQIGGSIAEDLAVASWETVVDPTGTIGRDLINWGRLGRMDGTGRPRPHRSLLASRPRRRSRWLGRCQRRHIW